MRMNQVINQIRVAQKTNDGKANISEQMMVSYIPDMI